MERQIVRSKIMLGRPSEPATPADAATGQDLLDTLAANASRCVGMAANMIGVCKRIIVVADVNNTILMYNPQILRKDVPFSTEEGCLSLDGVRPVTRYKKIRVRYEDEDFVVREQVFRGWTAQIIQHEIDHCDGVLI